ncbi:MAG: AN1-type zinc finger protein [Promethearchaeota archaeon]
MKRPFLEWSIGVLPDIFDEQDINLILINSNLQCKLEVRSFLIITVVILIILTGLVLVVVWRKRNIRKSYRSPSYKKSKIRHKPVPNKECAFEPCGVISVMPFVYKFCGKSFCIDHRLPENHGCIVLATLEKKL